jgi:hypothetical protein
MEPADETRKHWASLLAGNGPAGQALDWWLGLAASAMENDPEGEEPSPMDTPLAAGWPDTMGPVFRAWADAAERVQGSASSWFSPASENPLARALGHPAAVVGGGNSQSRLMLQAVVAAAELMQTTAAHQTLQSQGWMKAFQRFAADFFRNNDAGAKPVVVTSLDDLFSHWSTVGESALQEHSRGERFLESQAQMLRKSMRFRLAQRQVVEAAARANDLPTLTDLDEAFAAIHALRSEIRGLRRIVETAPPAANAPVLHPKPRARSGTRRVRSVA